MCWQKCMKLYYEMLDFEPGNTSLKDTETKLGFLKYINEIIGIVELL